MLDKLKATLKMQSKKLGMSNQTGEQTGEQVRGFKR
jgi:hypothetical protein